MPKDSLVKRYSWSPIYFEPTPGSGERISFGLVVHGEDGERLCVPLLGPAALRALFPADESYVKDLIALCLQSVDAHVSQKGTVSGWAAPIDGVFLGSMLSAGASSADEVSKYAAPLSSAYYRMSEGAAGTRKVRQIPWAKSVKDILLKTNAKYVPNLDVSVVLGSHEVPARFTFLNPDLAANVVALRPEKLSSKVEDARAKLWALDLLEDAPSWLHRPKRKELLAGVLPKDSGKSGLVLEAVEELADEALRRGVGVKVVSSPEEAVSHILNCVGG